MNIVIRPFQEDADYERLEETEKLIIPDEWDSADFYREEDQQAAGHPNGRWLVFDGEKPIGNAEYLLGYWWDEPDQYIIYSGVIPEYQGRGVGKQLHTILYEKMAELGAKTVLTWVRDDYPRTIRFLEERGYTLKQRDLQSELLLNEVDLSRFDEMSAGLRDHGVMLVPLSKLQETDADWLMKLYDLDWPLRLDMPGSEAKKRESLEDWRARKIDSDYTLLDGLIVAVNDANEYVGYSSVKKHSSGAKKLMTGTTGVLSEYRRKGIATAMKLRIIEFGKASGYEKIMTENEENNPMYKLNVMLGFRPTPSWLTYKAVL